MAATRTQDHAKLQAEYRPSRSLNTMIWLLCCLFALFLLNWPAWWNGYPIVFADTGTYLSQAIRHYLGWDRPAFYSIFLLILHWKLTTWPVILAQAGMTIYVVRLAQRSFAPRTSSTFLLATLAILSVATPLPWVVSELMPDLFTGLLAVALAVLVLSSEDIPTWELNGLAAIVSGMIAVHLSNLWIAACLLAILLPCRRMLGAPSKLAWPATIRAGAPLLAAALMLSAVNFAAFHRFSVSPYGNVFLFTRLLYDGSVAQTLEEDCSSAKWQVCGLLPELPPNPSNFKSSDMFLWKMHGPLEQIGGAKHFSAEAGQIISRTIHERPMAVAEGGVNNVFRQLFKFRSGDGLNAWPEQVGPVIGQYFPEREKRAFSVSLQSRGDLKIPHWMVALHQQMFWLGLAGTACCLMTAIRRRQPAALLCASVLLCIMINAGVTGAMSGPHDRYQNRIIWLATLAPLITVPVIWRPMGRRVGKSMMPSTA